VLNLGQSGNSLLGELAVFREYAEPIGIGGKTVLLFYFEGNDLEELLAHSKSPTLMKYLKDDNFSQALINQQELLDLALEQYLEREIIKEKRKDIERVDGWYTVFFEILKMSHLRRRLGISLVVPTESIAKTELLPPSPPLDLLREGLETMYKRVNMLGGDLYIVYLPHWSRYGADTPERGARYRNQVLAIVNDLGVPLIDVHEAFVEHPDPLSLFPFRVEGHYNAAGYAVVVEKLLNTIK
jgi:hypothetical protein